jgi:Tfp pilus assembly protein PilN
MNSALTQDIQVWLSGLSIAAGLFLISLVRIFLLSRSNSRMRAENTKMEKQAVLQQVEVTSIHHDAMSWRAKIQRQFDALRSELSHRLQQSEKGGTHALNDFDEAHKKALAKISELEAALSAKPAAVALPPLVTPALPKPPPPSLPGLPAVDSLRIQSLEAELAAAKAEIASGRLLNATLQRALLLARRKVSVPATRKSATRSTVRSA